MCAYFGRRIVDPPRDFSRRHSFSSFDEVVVVLFLSGLDNTTIPIQMWTGLREQLSPTILAVATCLIILSILILVTAELLRRRSERLRGINR